MPLSHSSLIGSGVLPEGHGPGNVSGKVLQFLKMNLKYKNVTAQCWRDPASRMSASYFIITF